VEKAVIVDLQLRDGVRTLLWECADVASFGVMVDFTALKNCFALELLLFITSFAIQEQNFRFWWAV